MLAAGAVALAGCTTAPGKLATSPAPSARPNPPASTAEPAVRAPSEASRALTDYYTRIQQAYLAQGLLRVDGGGPDTPITERQLVDNFVRIALFEEFSNIGGQMVRSETATRLHRWNGPIRMSVKFGDSVPIAKRERDTAQVARFAARLARLTGLSITVTDKNPNFHIFIVNEDERRVIGPKLRAISPEIDTIAVNTVQEMRQSTLCLVFSIDGRTEGIYETAVAVIRGEHPDLLRLSCIHEELAQGLGLPNDSPLARPSVFNDDEEFGLLTTHDEYLLQMLYDPRMRPGMTAEEARPVAQVIAAEILSGPS
jgi:hypothetical protein